MNSATASVHRRFKRHPVASGSSNARRRRSMSPEEGMEDAPNRPDSNVLRKKKKGAMQSIIAAATQNSQSRNQRASVGGGEAVETVRRLTMRPTSVTEEGQDPQSSRKPQKSKKRDRSQSRDPARRASLKTESADEAGMVEQLLLGSTTDYEKMKDELEALKKHMSAAKKTIGRQNKAIEDLRKDLAHAQQSHHEERQQVEVLRTKHQKAEEVISTIEANMNCQVCMDILMKPYGLSPCGHVLCLGCLQNWFRSAPPGDDEMYDDDPDVVLYRKKTCPACRAVVFSRPIPLFLVKSIASALEKSKQPEGASTRSSPIPEGDPWEGIFPEMRPDDWMDEDDDYDEYGYADDDDIFPDEYYSDDDDEEYLDAYDEYASDIDDDDYDGEWVSARWAPPTVHVPPEHYPFDNLNHETLSMLRRGATQPMIELFRMSYSHQEGLRAIIDDNVVFLGWNIQVRPDDEEGEQFMAWTEADVYNHPERWDRDEQDDGTWVAWRLVREDEDLDYDNTDSEAYDVDDDY